MLDQTNFLKFTNKVSKQFEEMSKEELFVADLSGDKLWEVYLAAFPPGTNEPYLERTEHDCSCCKNFIRNLGPIIGFKNGKVVSVWDVDGLPSPYDKVADCLSTLVKSRSVQKLFRSSEKKYGNEHNIAIIKGTNRTIKWHHFEGQINRKHYTKMVGTEVGKAEASAHVLKRGLQEITLEAIDQVLYLISEKILYRGEENQKQINSFRGMKVAFDKLKTAKEQSAFVWQNIYGDGVRLRNSSIGQLLQDLSEGVELEQAVKKYEAMVAPQNYKRPKALVTPQMVAQAEKTLIEIGLEPALHRRFAKPSDVSVNDVLFVDREAAKGMKDGGILGILKDDMKPKEVNIKNPVEITVDKFVEEVLPGTKRLNIVLRNQQMSKFVTLTAPERDTKSLFKWANDFAWSYDGDVADSLRNQVAAAGGRVDGVLRFSHTWNYDGKNQSLMDLHVFMPGNQFANEKAEVGDRYGNHERVGWNHRKHTASGGVQDVDYTDPPGKFVPVENITFPRLDKLKDGQYAFKIHNWSFRNPTTSGFKAEIEILGEVYEYHYEPPLKNKEWVTVAVAHLKKGQFTIEHKLPLAESISKKKWGVNTNTEVPVSFACFSPNHWGDQKVGARHLFFILKGCNNPEPVRGFYNEYLNPKLEKHKRVFELLGDKLKCEPVEDQLSGVGFTQGRGDSVIVTADYRPYKIVF